MGPVPIVSPFSHLIGGNHPDQPSSYENGLGRSRRDYPMFCDPQSPWQKGSVENTNRRARKWLPRDLDPLSVNDSDLKRICDQLNTTPRKCLGFKTPSEVFRQKMMTAPRRSG